MESVSRFLCRTDHWDTYLEILKEMQCATSSCLSVSWHLHTKDHKSFLWIRSLWAKEATAAKLIAPACLLLAASICLSMPLSPEVLSMQFFFSTVVDSYTFPVLFCFVHDWRCMFSVGIGGISGPVDISLAGGILLIIEGNMKDEGNKKQ